MPMGVGYVDRFNSAWRFHSFRRSRSAAGRQIHLDARAARLGLCQRTEIRSVSKETASSKGQ